MEGGDDQGRGRGAKESPRVCVASARSNRSVDGKRQRLARRERKGDREIFHER